MVGDKENRGVKKRGKEAQRERKVWEMWEREGRLLFAVRQSPTADEEGTAGKQYNGERFYKMNYTKIPTFFFKQFSRS